MLLWGNRKIIPLFHHKIEDFLMQKITTTNQTVLSARARDSRHRFIARDPL